MQLSWQGSFSAQTCSRHLRKTGVTFNMEGQSREPFAQEEFIHA
jgi:hypothetical protein